MSNRKIDLDFPYEFYQRGRDALIVFFPSVRMRKIYPCYSRIKWADDLSCADLLYLADPFQELPEYQESGGSWYIDTDGNSQIETIARKLSPLLDEYKNILFYGSSMGGYLALNFSKYFKNVSVIAECPQIFLDNYRLAKELVNRICTPEQKKLLPYTADALLTEHNNLVYLYVNRWDHHFLKHIEPLMEVLEKKCSDSEQANKVYVTQYFNSSYKREHTAFQKDDALPIIKLLIGKEDIIPTKTNIIDTLLKPEQESNVETIESSQQDLPKKDGTKILIWGSCVSRDAFDFVNNPHQVIKFISRQSFATGLDDRGIEAKDFLDKKKKEAKDKKYFLKCLESDFLKLSKDEIIKTDFDVFVLELIDERFRIAQCNSGLYTYSTTGKTVEYHRVEKITLHDFDSDFKFELWSKGIMKLFSLLKEKNIKIILNKVYWTHNTSDSFSKEKLSDIVRNNMFLDKLYNFIEEKYGNIIEIISYPTGVFEADVNHKWNHEPFHYTLPTYEYFMQQFNEIILQDKQPLLEQKNGAQDNVDSFQNLKEHEKNIAGYYEFGTFLPTYLGTPIDWFKDPYKDRNWQWSLHAFNFFMKHYDKDGHFFSESLEFLDQLLEDWLEKFVSPAKDSEFPWHDHATALRLDRVIEYYKFLKEKNILTENQSKIFKSFILIHCEKLAQESFYSQHTNHGFDQAVSLFQASALFGYDDFKELALKRFIDELKFAFTTEGIHVENSPGYHKGMITNVLRALALIKKHGEVALEGFDLPLFLNNAIEFLMYCMRCDYRLAYIGDTPTYGLDLTLDENKNIPLYSTLKKLSGKITLEKNELLPQVKLYEKSGYFFYRSDWSNIKNSTHIIMKCGYLSPYHRQDDDLNILLSGMGEDWLIDSGLYSHNQKDLVRIYMRSARAHNVPIFDNIPIIRSYEELKDKDISIFQEETPKGAVACVTARTYMYKNTPIRRRLIIHNEHHFTIRDLLPKKITTNGTWLFHVPMDKIIKIKTSEIQVIGKHAIMTIKPKFVYHKDDGSKAKSRYKINIYQGWNNDFPSVVSFNMNQKIDSQVIAITAKDMNFSDFEIKLTCR